MASNAVWFEERPERGRSQPVTGTVGLPTALAGSEGAYSEEPNKQQKSPHLLPRLALNQSARSCSLQIFCAD